MAIASIFGGKNQVANSLVSARGAKGPFASRAGLGRQRHERRQLE